MAKMNASSYQRHACFLQLNRDKHDRDNRHSVSGTVQNLEDLVDKVDGKKVNAVAAMINSYIRSTIGMM